MGDWPETLSALMVRYVLWRHLKISPVLECAGSSGRLSEWFISAGYGLRGDWRRHAPPALSLINHTSDGQRVESRRGPGRRGEGSVYRGSCVCVATGHRSGECVSMCVL